MPSVTEDRLTFDFPATWSVSKFDEWSFYRNQFQAIPGTKAIDILAVTDDCCWMIEIKDYRHNRRQKQMHIAEEVAIKVRDSLAGLAAARVNANDNAERSTAAQALRRARIRVVLHLEQPPVGSRLFSPLLNAANVQQRLRQYLKPVDAHPWVRSMTHMTGCAWTVTG